MGRSTCGGRRSRAGFIPLVAVVGVVVGLTASCGSGTPLSSSITLVPTLPGTVSNVVEYEFWGQQVFDAQIRFTSGTGRAIEVEPFAAYSEPTAVATATTVVDGGPGSPWTTVARLQGRNIPRLPSGNVSLRLTTSSPSALPVTVEVRALDGNQQPASLPVKTTSVGQDCDSVTARTDLRAVDLSNRYLRTCVLPGVTVDPAKLVFTDLHNADLSGATILPGALDRTDLRGAVLRDATLVGVDFTAAGAEYPTPGISWADLRGADLRGATFSGVDLEGARLDGADLSTANLAGVRTGLVTGSPLLPPGWVVRNGFLVGAGADLSAADLTGADLTGIDLTGTVLRGAQLRDADLDGADLTGADLSGARLTGADLTGATLAEVDLTGATGTPIYAGVDFSTTTCPDGTSGAAHGNTCQGHPWP